MLEVGSTNHAIWTFGNTINVKSDTFDEPFDDNFHAFDLTWLSDECLREEIDGTDGVGELHLLCFFDSYSIAPIGAEIKR